MLTMKTIDESTHQSAMYDLMKIIILVAMNPYSWKWIFLIISELSGGKEIHWYTH